MLSCTSDQAGGLDQDCGDQGKEHDLLHQGNRHICHLEQGVQHRDQQYGKQQYTADDEGTDGEGVGQEAKPEDGFLVENATHGAP